MSNSTASLKARLNSLREVRAELATIRKEAFMAAPPMPGGGAPMDPATMQGGGMPPVDTAMMQGGGGMPMDPAMMQGGMPPTDPATGMPMDPAMIQGGAPPADPSAAPGGGAPLTPEMLEQLLGVIEELAAASEKQETVNQELAARLEELSAQIEEMDRRAAVSAAVLPGAAV